MGESEKNMPKESSSSKIEDKITSPRRADSKISTENSFKTVQLALDFAKNGKEIIKLAEEDKKGNLSKIVKLVKKIVPTAVLTKLMKLNLTDMDRRRQNSLQEFVYITEKLKQRVVNVKEQDVRMAEDIKQAVQEGHMILAVVILNEMHTIMSLFGADNSSISRPNLVRLLNEVKNYCDSVNTMKFPTEWENITQELSKEKKGNSGVIATNSGGVRKKQSPRVIVTSAGKDSARGDTGHIEGESDAKSPTRFLPREDGSYSDKDDSDKEESYDEGNETHTVQIEIRGNTGGFVGSTIEFDLVVTHEDGSPVKVHASDFGVEIHGPASSSPVNITAKGKEEDGAFRIEFTPKEPGANALSIFMHKTLLTSGIKSVISKAGETAFLVHPKDISRGQLQGISVVPTAQTNPKLHSRADVLKQKLEDIATALDMLESLRAKTLLEMDSLSANVVT